MMKHDLQNLLRDFKSGKISEEEMLHWLAFPPSESLGFATIDHHRALRQGFPEVVLCSGKTPQQVASIAQTIVKHGHRLLATRATPQHFRAVKRILKRAQYHEAAKAITFIPSTDAQLLSTRQRGEKLERKHGKRETEDERRSGTILVITAGTSDIPVAEEAVVTAEMMGSHVEKLYDVGVAGIHRLLAHTQLLKKATVIIVVAGMEGALASVVGGLVDVPVIAVPTSVGYGASFHGLSALLGMLNSCAAGVTVVNIDNGFGAGFAASLMNRVGMTRAREDEDNTVPSSNEAAEKD